MIYFFIFLIFFITILIIVYNIHNIRKIDFIENLKLNKINKILIILFVLLSLVIVFNLMDFFIIMIHLGVFTLISNLILIIIEKIRKKEIKKNNLKVIMGLIITVIYLGIGAYLCFHIFETKYEVLTDKDINLRIIQIADSHVGTTFDGEGFTKEIEKLSKIDADLFVITGDFVDDDTTIEDMVKSCEALSLLHPKYGVYYVFGNHDRGYFNKRKFSGDDLIKELEKNNVHVLIDEVVTFDNFYLIGREDASNNKRLSIDTLVKDLDDRYKIVLNHQPNDYDNEENKVDLVLSGHTHGGQMIPLGLIGTLSSNDLEQGMETRDNTTFIVTSGISDWSVHFKTGTKSEYVIIDVKKK